MLAAVSETGAAEYAAGRRAHNFGNANVALFKTNIVQFPDTMRGAYRAKLACASFTSTPRAPTVGHGRRPTVVGYGIVL